MRSLIIALAAALLAYVPAARAGRTPSGTITTQASTACTDAAAVVLSIPANTSSVVLSVQGTFSQTLQVRVSTDGTQFVAPVMTPLGGGAVATSITAPGQWGFSAANVYQVCVYGSAVVSGTASLILDYSWAPGQPTRPSGSISLSATSPAAASTVAGTAVAGLDAYNRCSFYAKVTGATGGTLDVYVQTSLDGGTTWVDAVHFTQLAAGGGAAAYAFSLSRGRADGTAITGSLNTASASPAIGANTIVNVLGNQLRVVFVAGASTSAGAAQVLTGFCSA